MKGLLVVMDVHKEKIVVVGLPGEGSHPVLRDEFGSGISIDQVTTVRLILE